MKSIIMLPLALLAGTAVAASECGADYIVEACLSSEKAKLAACKHDDYVCKCENWKNIVTYAAPHLPTCSTSAHQSTVYANN
jgi:hypothetical protein